MKRVDQKERIYLLSLHSSCENSSYNLSKIETFLRNNQYEIVEDIELSTIVIVNTCAYSDQMQFSNEESINEILTLHPDKKILIFGCLINLTSMKELSNLSFVGNSETKKISEMFNHFLPFESCHTSRLTHFTRYQDNITTHDSFVQICQGCCNNCSYCNIKLAKGAIKSKPIEIIEEEVRRLIKEDVFEITLLADDCGSYGRDLDSSIVELTSGLLDIDGKLRLKIYSIFPELFLEYYQGLKPFIREQRITYICVPLQSASARILKLMNRDYDLTRIRETLKDIKLVSPDTYLFTHFMINFPCETVQDFERSLEAAKLFDSSMFIPYQENRRTPAYRITRKCTGEELIKKMDMLRSYIDRRLIKAVLVGG